MPNFFRKAIKDPVNDGPDTVVVFCMSIVQKQEYDEFGVQQILPAQVVGKDGKANVVLPACLVVAKEEDVVMHMNRKFKKLYDTYKEKLDNAKRNGGHRD